MGKYYKTEYDGRRFPYDANRKLAPAITGVENYRTGGLLKSRFDSARRLKFLNNQPPKHPCLLSLPPTIPFAVDIVCLRADILWCLVRMRWSSRYLVLDGG